MALFPSRMGTNVRFDHHLMSKLNGLSEMVQLAQIAWVVSSVMPLSKDVVVLVIVW